ncbi:unnamed protein product [Lathyrus sativus]|nr:unnamed protein product [Lathyrus sativus]
MDSRVVQSKVVENKDEQNLDPQQVVTHDAEEHNSIEPEKKSVMSRVKARARKIKNSITGHGQQTPDQTSGHNTEIQHTPEDDEDEDDDDDDGDLDEGQENVQEPLRYAPNYGSRDVKSATTPTTEYEKVENLRNLVFNLEGSKVVGEEPHHDPLNKGVSSKTETNQSIDTDKAKPFDLEEKPDQFKADFERPRVSKEDSQEQRSRTEAYDLPSYQTRDTDPNLEVYDRESVKSATPKFGSEQDETLGNSGTDFEGGRVKGEEPRRDSLAEGVSSRTTETNQNIAKPFSEEDKPDQFKANLAKLGFSKEDFEDQVNRTEAYTPPKHQTNDNYPSEDVKNATPPPEYKQDENFGNSGTGFEGAKVKGEEPLRDSLFEGVPSTTTETNQNIAKPFAEEEKPEQFKADLERPGFSEDFEEQGSRIEAYTLPKYQTSDTYPNEEGKLKDIKPLEESLERLNVHDDEPKIQPHAADTEYPPSAGSHDQFVPHFSDATETKSEYPRETVSTDINRDQEFSESTDTNRDQEFSEKDSQDQGSRTEAYTIPGYQTRDTDPSGARSDEIEDFTPIEESLEKLNVHDDESKPITEQKIKPSVADTEYPASAGSHDIRQPVPHFFDASKSHNEFSQETVSKNSNKNHEIPSETEGTFNTVPNTAENQPGYEDSVETQPKHKKSYADENEFSSATTADKTLPRENDEVYNLGNDGTSTGAGSNTNDGTETKGGDKGAAVRDYFNEKSRPGEEDKALAEVISEALHKGKDEPLKSEDAKLDSEVEKPEKVYEESNVASPGKGMVDRVKGVVGSWFAKSEESPSPHDAGIGTEDISKNKDSVPEVKHDGKVVDEGRIQE